MGKLEIKINSRARWWGKDGNIDIIVSDNAGKFLVGKCNWSDEPFSMDEYNNLLENVSQAEISADYIYLFSKEGFKEEINQLSIENPNIKLISLNDF